MAQKSWMFGDVEVGHPLQGDGLKSIWRPAVEVGQQRFCSLEKGPFCSWLGKPFVGKPQHEGFCVVIVCCHHVSMHVSQFVCHPFFVC